MRTLTRRDERSTKPTMLRRFAPLVLMVGLLSCSTTPDTPVAWLVLSPTPSASFPHGDLNSPLSSWTQIRQFLTSAECQNSLREIHNQLHRPVSCIASNDPRLAKP